MHDYNIKARAYWWTVFSVGAVLLANAGFSMISLSMAQLVQVATAICFAAVVGFFPVTIPGTKVSIAGGEIFIFLIMLLVGVEAAVLVAAIEGAVGSIRSSKRWTSWFGTPAMAAIAMSLSGSLYMFGREALEAKGLLNGGTLLLALTLLAVTYFIFNIWLTSALIAIKRNESIKPIAWLRNLSWIALAYVGSAAVAAMLYQAGSTFGIWVLVAGAPIIVMFISTAHFTFERAEAAQQTQAALLVAATRETESAHKYSAALVVSEKRFRGAFDNAAIGMMLVSRKGAVLEANPALCKMLGCHEMELIKEGIASFMPVNDFSLLLSDIDAISLKGSTDAQRELTCINREGSEFGVAFSVSVFALASELLNDATAAADHAPDFIVQMQDIRSRKQAEAKLLHIAFHDMLTGLPNRAYFRDQLTRAIARAKRAPKSRFALMFLDFDRFKAVNDSLGHSAGDELLIAFAARIKGVLRPTDTVARLGGDEFALLIEDLQDDTHVLDLARRLQETFHTPFHLHGTNITSSASIGIAFASDRYETPDDVIRDADLAMYKAKNAGKAQYAVFDSSLYDYAAAKLQLENDLRRAIEHDELRVHYQPQYGLRDRVLRGHEALVRWAHPQRGLLYPASFLPVAEETGLIVPLGRWVIREVCLQMQRMQQTEQGASLRMSINVTSRELREPHFSTTILAALKEADIQRSLLTIELSERALIEGNLNAIENVAALRAAGVTLCVDDFGTGFSSLSHLANLPIDSIKIDRGFVHLAEQTHEAKEIVRAITSLGRALGKAVHAQGVETEAQWRVLTELGCEIGQGNVCSPPITAAELNQVMSTSRILRASL